MAVVSVVNISELGDTIRTDAEYYQPKYLESERKVLETKSYKLWKQIRGQFVTGPFGSEFIVESYLEDSPYRYVRGRDVKDFFLLDDDNVYIPEKDFSRLSKYALQIGDILISVVGTLGNAAIVDKDILPAIFSCKSTIFRSQSMNPFYLVAYLNSKYGRSFLERKVRGAVQTGLNIDDLKSTPIFIPSKSEEDRIVGTVQEAKRLFDLSKHFYSKAQNLLLDELGLKDFKPKYELSYTKSLSEAFGVNRIDAEYFQPIYYSTVEYLNAKSGLTALQRCLFNFQKGVEVGSENYQEKGKPFIRVSNLSVEGLIEKDQKYISEELYQQLKNDYEPRIGDLLLTKDATPGIAYVVKEPVEGIICSGILKLVIDETEINKEYLALCINSIFGRLQIERDGGGSVIIHWRPEQIKKLKIPLAPQKVQQKIAELVQQSHEAREKAKGLMEEAKRRVEEAIERISN